MNEEKKSGWAAFNKATIAAPLIAAIFWLVLGVPNAEMVRFEWAYVGWGF